MKVELPQLAVRKKEAEKVVREFWYSIALIGGAEMNAENALFGCMILIWVTDYFASSLGNE